MQVAELFPVERLLLHGYEQVRCTPPALLRARRAVDGWVEVVCMVVMACRGCGTEPVHPLGLGWVGGRVVGWG